MTGKIFFSNTVRLWYATLPIKSVAVTCSLHYAYSAVVFHTVVPETRGRELLSDDYSHAVYYTLPHPHDVTCRQRDTSCQGHRTIDSTWKYTKTYNLKQQHATSSFVKIAHIIPDIVCL